MGAEAADRTAWAGDEGVWAGVRDGTQKMQAAMRAHAANLLFRMAEINVPPSEPRSPVRILTILVHSVCTETEKQELESSGAV